MANLLTLVVVSLALGTYGCSRQGPVGDTPTRSYMEDEVTVLPGLKDPPGFRQYSGYLRASPTRRYHYWFVESQRDPANDPLVLWLNGGPGCSSLSGMLTENGPFRVSEDSEVLTLDPTSWNKIANVIFLESPAGVGYSFATDYNFTTTDDQVAEDNYRALKDFFRLFNHFSNHKFYITGESYAGIYIPTLLVLLKDDPDIEVQGAAIGNGYMNPPLLANTQVAYWYYHGFIGTGDWNAITTSCCNDVGQECMFLPFTSAQCKTAVSSVLAKMNALPIDAYNVYETCKGDGFTGSRQNRLASSIAFQIRQMALQFDDPQSVLEITKLSSASETQPTCTDSRKEAKYLNQNYVRMALHIPDHVTGWTECSPLVGRGVPPYTYNQLYQDMTPQFLQILHSGVRLLVFNGDLDTVCDFLGDEMFVDSLNLKELQAHKPWYYQDTDGSTQIGGFTRKFEGLTYLTVKGAGHMVPTDKPVAAFEMFRRFLENEAF